MEEEAEEEEKEEKECQCQLHSPFSSHYRSFHIAVWQEAKYLAFNLVRCKALVWRYIINKITS